MHTITANIFWNDETAKSNDQRPNLTQQTGVANRSWRIFEQHVLRLRNSNGAHFLSTTETLHIEPWRVALR